MDCVEGVEGFVRGCFGGGRHLVNYWVLITELWRESLYEEEDDKCWKSKLLPRRDKMMLVSTESFESGNLPWKYREIKRPLNK